MASLDYFSQYIEIISEGFKKTRKGGFKKFNLVKQLIDTLEGFLSKEMYGRIEPSNYLIFFLLMLGSRNQKMINTAISTIQKLFSHNFISSYQDLSSSFRLIKDQHRELLLLPIQEYGNKSFKQLYVLSLVSLPERDDGMSLLIAKNISLIWRMGENTLSVQIVQKIYDFLIEAIILNKADQNDKVLKSAFLEIVRHTFESYRESLDASLLEESENLSIKSACSRYGKVLFDQVTIRLKVGQQNYEIIPNSLADVKPIIQFKEVNQKNIQNGKFGWCIVCRNEANYYCRIYKVPVCSFQCKQTYLNQTNQLDKLLSEQNRSAISFRKHTNKLTSLFARDLSHPDIRRRVTFSEIFVFVCSELKKFQSGIKNSGVTAGLHNVFRKTILNIMTESEAFFGCLICTKKMIYFRIFVDEIQLLFEFIKKKLTHFLTTNQIREDLLKFLKEFINNQIFLDLFMTLDLRIDRADTVKDLIEAIAQNYVGIEVPQGVPPVAEPNNKKIAFQIVTHFMKKVITNQKMIDQQKNSQLKNVKEKKNNIRNIIQQFNKTQKPVKIIKRLIKEKKIGGQPRNIAQFFHQHLKRLSLVNLGQYIGSDDQFAQKVRDEYIGQISFQNATIDQALRILLQYFTLPGESQVVARIIESFSNAYFKVNQQKKQFYHSDAVYAFSYLLMMLQTNLHSPQVEQKMTLQQFSNLSKGMNGEVDFHGQFLEKVYISVQKTQLGFHSSKKDIEIMAAYKENPKKAQQLHLKQLQKEAKKAASQLRNEHNVLVNHQNKYSLDLIIEQTGVSGINVYLQKIRQIQQREEIKKYCKQIQEIMKFSTSFGISSLVEHAIKIMWQQITKTTTAKKYTLIQEFLEWVTKFNQYVYSQWTVVILMLSKFNRNRLIRKQPSKTANLAIINDKCFIYQHFVENVISKSSKFTVKNLTSLISGFIQISRSQINDNCHPFCLQKIGEVLQANNSRLGDIFQKIWPILREYYIQLGKHRVQKVALFGTDFLKQLITKFIKKKDLVNQQKQYLKPFEQIFEATQAVSVKQLIIGSVGYFANNHNTSIKSGWKVLLSILASCFEDQQERDIKHKAFGIIKKIFEPNFNTIDLDENYVDLLQILGKLSREKQEIYPKGCIQFSKNIIAYYHKKFEIDPQQPQAVGNKSLDIHFLQTVWLPLLSTIYGICGDMRKNVQGAAVDCLFDVLLRYGKLFKYEFWKMVLQGVLRPTFQQIIYTSQSKSLKKIQLQSWLQGSFELLFSSIGKLIAEYFQEFRLFLFDVLKIYQNCLLNFSSKILIKLTVDALIDLFSKVGSQFQTQQWDQFFKFIDNVIKKSIPNQITSIEAWRASKTNESFYEGKCLSMHLLMSALHQIADKFGIELSQDSFLQVQDLSQRVYTFSHSFNKDITRRQTLWKQGFFQQMKSLPGLIKQEHQALKCLTFAKFKLRVHQQKYLKGYLKHSIFVLDSYSNLLIVDPIKQNSVQIQEQEREGTMLQILLLDMIFQHCRQIGFSAIKELGFKQSLFEAILGAINQKTYCSKCKFCEFCETNSQRQKKFSKQTKQLIAQLFRS